MSEARGVVWITGASSGIGWASALVLARRGWTVAASARNVEKLKNLASRDENIHPYPLDVADAEARRTVHAKIVSDLGPVDVLVNNAGYGLRGAVEEAKMHELRDLYDVNVFAPLALAQLVLPEMRRRRKGRIVNVSSVVGRVANPLSGLYSSSKFALEGWSDSMRMELIPWGVKVILVEPGPIKTRFARSAKSHSEEKLNTVDSPYAPYYQRLVSGGGQGAGTPWSASTVAWAIRRAVEDSRPYARYPVHYLAWLAPLFRTLLPTSIFDRVMAGMYGLEERGKKGEPEVTE